MTCQGLATAGARRCKGSPPPAKECPTETTGTSVPTRRATSSSPTYPRTTAHNRRLTGWRRKAELRRPTPCQPGTGVGSFRQTASRGAHGTRERLGRPEASPVHSWPALSPESAAHWRRTTPLGARR
eukprot:scaffold2428_cov412-Prasinococcus_capsulatus_cf.AAC.10